MSLELMLHARCGSFFRFPLQLPVFTTIQTSPDTSFNQITIKDMAPLPEPKKSSSRERKLRQGVAILDVSLSAILE